MTGIEEWLVRAGAAAVALTALAALWRGSRPFRCRISRWHQKLGQAADVILGSGPVLDPMTGRELRPAVPGIGQRMSRAEELLEGIVATSIDEARQAARASARSAAAAEESAAAARSALGVMAHELDELRAMVAEWQTVDRVRADGLTAVVTELGLETELPHHRKDTSP